MTGFDGFLLIFALIYGAECALWVPQGAFVAIAWWGGKADLLEGRGLFFKNPLLFGRAYKAKIAQGASLDYKALEAELARVERATRLLRWLGRSLLLVGLVAVVLLLAHIPHLLFWGIWAACFLFLHLSIAPFYWRAHRSLYPGKRGQRWGTTLMVFVSPWQSSRGFDLLEQDALASYHPLALAKALCSEEDLKKLAAKMLRRLHHPTPWDVAEEGELELGALEAWLREQGIRPNELLVPPTKDPNSKSWCPRCLAQYRSDEGECGDCQVGLEKF